jgi:hypothetical protein
MPSSISKNPNSWRNINFLCLILDGASRFAHKKNSSTFKKCCCFFCGSRRAIRGSPVGSYLRASRLVRGKPRRYYPSR